MLKTKFFWSINLAKTEWSYLLMSAMETPEKDGKTIKTSERRQ